MIGKGLQVQIVAGAPFSRAVVWLIDFRGWCFQEAQGGPGFGAVVVEAGVETLKNLQVMETQDRAAQEGEDLASAGFLARARGVLLPQGGVAFPVVFVLHGPMASDRRSELSRTFLLTPEAGDEVAGFAFELLTGPLDPFAGAAHELPGTGKGADVLIQIAPGEVAALDATVAFFPVAYPFIGSGGEAILREGVEGGLVVLGA